MSEEMRYLSDIDGNVSIKVSSSKRSKLLREQIFELLDSEMKHGHKTDDIAAKYFENIFMRYVGFETSNTLELISQLREGVSYSSFVNLAEFTSIPTRELSNFISISSRTLDRRRKEGKLHPDESEKVYRLASLVARATEVLHSREEARHWLRTPKKALGGQIPLELADTQVGADEVKDLLGRIEHGVFS